ncbi:MAG: hypothetical protein KIT85_07200 [Pseudolabrys sp.]|nr:hypothetical protein [Pseudolabrys sp.]
MSKRKSRTPARDTHRSHCRRSQRRVRPSIGELSDREFAGTPTPPDAPPMTGDERNMAFARLFANIKQAWRACPAALCRRRHRCSWNDPARLIDCAGPPLSAEDLKAARADFCKTMALVAAERGL